VRTKTCIAGLVGAILVLSARPRAQSNDATRLFADYAGGDRLAVARALRTNQSYRSMQDDLLRLSDAWKKEGSDAAATAPSWVPLHVAFAFEIGLARSNSPNGIGDAVRWLNIARVLATLRPIDPSHRALDQYDRFEIALHRAAVAIIMSSPGFASLYLDALTDRLAILGRLPDAGPLVAPLLLARGVARETRTRPLTTEASDVITGRSRPGGEPMQRLVVSPRTPDQQQQLQAALTTFARLAGDPVVGAEAEVRCGLLWHRLNDQTRALAAVDRGLRASRDPVVSYWGQLVRGRVLEASNRPQDARTAYEQAAALMPSAQTPATAIAAILLMQNDRPGAEAWAARARAPRDGDVRDPWWLYWFGDLRMLDDLVRQVRGALP
jgi:hypothetical protein